ncbi:hypothetical protein PN477_19915 [Spirulina subsalsa CS-330]|uniref:LAGLIDADG endonuclease n=1 Tax=Spirulina TaxID=1154 RepID=UPI00232FAD62|nr:MULTISPECIES: LAGLIDADG endonuclease [Spirulina]MDB9496908.1 hypothetical protein [Spirulina subsalsa CS-330]
MLPFLDTACIVLSVAINGYIAMNGDCAICGQPITTVYTKGIQPKTCEAEACKKAYTLKKAREGDVKRRAARRYKQEQMGLKLIPCEVCGERFEAIQPAHLKKHGLTLKQYRELYPNVPIMTDRIKEERGKSSTSQAHYLSYNGKKPDRVLFEFLVGAMLGDGSLEKQKNKKNARYAEGGSNEDYIKSKFDFLKQYFHCTFNERLSSAHVKSGKQYQGYWLRTSVHPILTEWHELWYRDGIKVLPEKMIKEYFSFSSLLIWFCDDGCSLQRILFYTMAFTDDEVEFLADLLKSKFDLTAKIRRNKKKQPFLTLDSKSKWAFLEMCKSVNIPGMEYKLRGEY